MYNSLNKLPFFIENDTNNCELNEENFIEETHVTNTEIDKHYDTFKQQGLHLIHLNINSILPKIHQLHKIASKTNVVVIGL